MKRTENELDSRQVLSVIEKYSTALDLLDSYDHQNMKRPKGTDTIHALTYEECRDVIAQMRFGDESELFGKENDFVWELIDSPEKLNIPILVCEDDCNLSCIIIVVKIRKTEDRVYWDRLGFLEQSSWDIDAERHAGILCLEAYTEEDWQKYGDNIAAESYGSHEYWEWVGERGYEEQIRRLRNYMKPYMQKDENISWIKDVKWVFDRKQYEKMVERYREIAAAHLRSIPHPG